MVVVALTASCSNTLLHLPSTQANFDVPVFETVESCITAIQTSHLDQSGFLPADPIGILSWNIEKGANRGWREELSRLADNKDLILMQEAVLSTQMQINGREDFFWHFSPGYQNRQQNSGILTISRVRPQCVCSLQVSEPLLATPKATSVAKYAIAGRYESILVINIHLVNFSWGLSVFDYQLSIVSQLIAAHQGPVILAGDFNTWKDSRANSLAHAFVGLDLTALAFGPDNRTKVFGHYLDHIFIRGFEVLRGDTEQVITSDHNPLMATLMLYDKSLSFQ